MNGRGGRGTGSRVLGSMRAVIAHGCNALCMPFWQQQVGLRRSADTPRHPAAQPCTLACCARVNGPAHRLCQYDIQPVLVVAHRELVVLSSRAQHGQQGLRTGPTARAPRVSRQGWGAGGVRGQQSATEHRACMLALAAATGACPGSGYADEGPGTCLTAVPLAPRRPQGGCQVWSLAWACIGHARGT